MVKKAPVELVFARPVSSGKFVVLVSGAVADVEEAMACAIEAAGALLVDRLLLAQAADGVLTALRRQAPEVGATDAVGIFETFSVASALLAADAAAKAARVEVAELRLADGLGGKAYFVVAGEQADVEAAHVRRRACDGDGDAARSRGDRPAAPGPAGAPALTVALYSGRRRRLRRRPA